jgi:hypothetical protein
MSDFMSCDDDSAETTGVLDDGDTVDFLEAFVNYASSTNISESLKIIFGI